MLLWISVWSLFHVLVLKKYFFLRKAGLQFVCVCVCVFWQQQPHFVALAGLRLPASDFLPRPPKCWDYGHRPPCQARVQFSLFGTWLVSSLCIPISTVERFFTHPMFLLTNWSEGAAGMPQWFRKYGYGWKCLLYLFSSDHSLGVWLSLVSLHVGIFA